MSEVQSSLATAYTEMNTNVYEGWIMFPSAWVNLKLYEPGPYYTLIGFGSMTWHGLTINKDTYDELPDDFKEILHEVAADYEQQTGIVNASEYDRLGRRAAQADHRHRDRPGRPQGLGRDRWPTGRSRWPMIWKRRVFRPSRYLNLVLERAEANGYEWPVRYEVK